MRLACVFAVSLLGACRLPWQPAERACAERARLDLPIDAAALAGEGALWPFGVHGGPHPEGHPGVDFLLGPAPAGGSIPVLASYSAEIVSITPESGIPGSSCIVLDSACVEVNLCHVILDPTLKAGGKVVRGQTLGAVASLPAEGGYALHFGTYAGPEAEPACPADFLDPAAVECALGLSAEAGRGRACGNFSDTVTWMERSVYPERESRTLEVACADGSTQSFRLPSEAAFCNPRLAPADRARMEACLGSACAGVW